MPSRTSRQLCVDSRTPSSMARKCLSPRAFTPITTSTHRRPSSPRRPLWIPSAQTYTQSSARSRRHHSRYSSSHTRLSRLTTFADNPRAASSPTSCHGHRLGGASDPSTPRAGTATEPPHRRLRCGARTAAPARTGSISPMVFVIVTCAPSDSWYSPCTGAVAWLEGGEPPGDRHTCRSRTRAR